MQRGKIFNGFKFGTFTGRFPNDGGASMAVKGLKVGGGGMGEEKTTVGDVGADPGIWALVTIEDVLYGLDSVKRVVKAQQQPHRATQFHSGIVLESSVFC